MSVSDLNELKNRVLLHLYEHGAGKIGFELETNDICAVLAIDGFRFKEVYYLLKSQGLVSSSTMQTIGLSERGQQEAERLGPATSLRGEISFSGSVMNFTNSIFQVAGNNSTQTATQTIDQSVRSQIINEIEHSLDMLPIEPNQKEDAKSYLTALKSYAGKALDATGKLIATSLAAILTAAGSELGHRLLTLFS